MPNIVIIHPDFNAVPPHQRFGGRYSTGSLSSGQIGRCRRL